MAERPIQVALVGSPNVGKSVIFNYLTGTYVTVSNYPGTTVDISRGLCRIQGRVFEIIDTPGIYSLSPITDEERVTRRLLATEQPDLILHIVDAKNLRRMLNLTLQLLDAGLPVVLVLNIMDEAAKLGIRFRLNLLAKLLGIPVIAASAVHAKGMGELKQAILDHRSYMGEPFRYGPAIEAAVSEIEALLESDYGFSRRIISLLLLAGDPEIQGLIKPEKHREQILSIVQAAAADQPYALEYVLALQRQKQVDQILDQTMAQGMAQRGGMAERLGKWTRQPLTGIPILCLVLYFGLYQFVGKFGAGTLVDYIDNELFGAYIAPWAESAVQWLLPWNWAQTLIIGDYGVFTLGVRYAAAIILPIIGAFFLVFAILEDCGYLPRLAMLVDRIFTHFGLNGRAVIPVTLGLGCGTMAVMVTRTLETRRERVLATFLLSLAVPCSAQLGLVMALLSRNEAALALWCGYIVLVFILAGWVGAKVLPGSRSAFYMELPPLRMPVFRNVIMKAYTRMGWYFLEILPVFIIASFLLWLGDSTGVLQALVVKITPLMTALGLPSSAAQVFLLGFFRRDYGAAGLYDMTLNGQLNDQQLVVAAITLTLFLPCIAQFVVMLKERGVWATAIIALNIALISLLSGWFVHTALTYALLWKGWSL